MRFSIGLPHVEDADWSASGVLEIAQAIEKAGLDACYVTDHPFPVVQAGRPGHHALDPVVLLSAIAAVTTKLRLHTSVLVLPYRNPFLVARAVATLDHLSAGRVVLGVGSGYQREEFASLGVDYEERNLLLDEALVAMKDAWTGREVRSDGRHWKADGNSMLPRPVTLPHPPIWMGGNSTQAIKRAVTYCQGWSPIESSPSLAAEIKTGTIAGLEDLRAKISALTNMRNEQRRTEPFDICYAHHGSDWLSGSDQSVLEEIGAMGAIGVTYAAARFVARSKSELIERIQWFGELVSRAGGMKGLRS